MGPMAAFTVALVGPDGVGKTTLARRLERDAPERFRYVYMGDNAESARIMLPTTRWWAGRRGAAAGPRAAEGGTRRPDGALRTIVRPLRKALGLAHRMLEEAYRERVARRFVREGLIVVYDRHFLLDYLHGDARAGRAALGRRIQRFLRQRLLAPPDLVIILDAPGEVVFRRKREFTPEHLEQRRREYVELQSILAHTAVVDADREPGAVAADVRRAIDRFAANGGCGDGR